jgi:hypothetical protein
LVTVLTNGQKIVTTGSWNRCKILTAKKRFKPNFTG